jgi:hypothetical protein
MWITAAEVVGDAVLGLAVIADTNLIAGPYYHALARPWGPSLPTTQVLGGGVLWILGDIVGLPFLAAQLIQMIREDEADAKVIDAELDAQEAAAVAIAVAPGTVAPGTVAPGTVTVGTGAVGTGAAGGSGTPDGPAVAGEAGVPVTQRPWWETDRRFSDRFRSVDEPGNAAQ